MKTAHLIQRLILPAIALLLCVVPAAQAQLELKSPSKFNSITTQDPASRPVPTPQPASIGQPPADSQFSGVGVTSGSAGQYALPTGPAVPPFFITDLVNQVVAGSNPFFLEGGFWKVNGQLNSNSILTSPELTVATDGPVNLTFLHDTNFENTYDGGRVLVSRNGGAFTVVPFTGQHATVFSFGHTPGWTGVVAGINSSAPLFSGTAGETFRFRFEQKQDNVDSNAGANWTIKTVAISNTTAGSSGVPLGDTTALFPKANYLDGQGLTVSTYHLQSARVGNSFATGVPRYFMGDEITPPSVQADGTTLAGPNYWRRAPARPGEVFANPDTTPVTELGSGDVFGGGQPVAALAPGDFEDFYYSPHADRVFASQPGAVTLYWVASLPEDGKYKIRRESFTVSSASQGELRAMYWTEKSFNSPRVNIPSGRIHTVNPVYSKVFKPTVPEAQEYKPPGFIENPDPNARPPKELRTLFFEKTNGLGQIGAYNITGRILVEYLGAEIGPGRHEYLGMDVVEVERSMPSKNVTVHLGEQVLPEDGDRSLTGVPVLDISQSGQTYYGTRSLPDGRTLYDAEKENHNPDKVIFYWLKQHDAGIHLLPQPPGLSILWPKYQNRYLFVWPEGLGLFAHVTAGALGSTDATGLQFGDGDQPVVIFQDDGTQSETRYNVDTQRLITGLSADGDGYNRTLLKFSNGAEVWYVRLYTQAENRAGYQEGDGSPSINTTAVVGSRIERPGTGLAIAGFISEGTGYQASAYRDPFTFGVESAASGAIIPVNAIPGGNQLSVRWFTKVEPSPPNPAFSPFYVPSKVGRYTVSYPDDICDWSLAGPLAEERWFHTSTLLADGSVLVVGGYSFVTGLLASAELYDPATGTWTHAAPMNFGSWGHTATRLQSGKVLVAGGGSRAEVYDPASRTWTSVGSLSGVRVNHQATLLNDGRVLATGGEFWNGTEWVAVPSVYLFDPKTGLWTPVASMNSPRSAHAATLLADDRVLVAGGQTVQGVALASAEIYDPVTLTWTSIGGMLSSRRSASATTLADGRVLLAGGFGPGGVLSTAELYNPATGVWSATANTLTTASRSHTATLMPNGKVLLTSMADANAFGTSNTEMFDPGTSLWSVVGSPVHARYAAATTLMADGKVLISGGWVGTGPSKTVELLDAVGMIVMASNQGTADLTPAQAAGTVYQQNDSSQAGFNPNEEHAVKVNSRFYALRDDLNVTTGTGYTSEPFVLIAYTDPDDGRPAMRPFKVLREDTRHKFSYPWLAGTKIQGPEPLPSMNLPTRADGRVANTEVDITPDAATGGGAPATYAKFTFEDRQGYKWVYRGTHDGGDHQFGMQWYYPMAADFFIPGQTAPPVGTALPYLRPLTNGVPQGHAVTGTALTVNYTPEWPKNPPELRVAETLTLAKFGLPDVRNQMSAEVYYQQSVANQGSTSTSVILHDPTVYKQMELEVELPAKIRTSTLAGKVYFQGLPPHLQTRFFLDPLASAKGTLVLKGEFHDEVAGEDYLDLNVLSAADETALKDLAKGDPDHAIWSLTIEYLTTVLDTWKENPSQLGTFIIDPSKHRWIGRNQLVDIRDSDTPRDSYALTATGRGEGYVTLVFGNGRNPAQTPQGDPPVIQIVKVAPQLYTGDLKVILSDNPLDEKVSLRHSGDFAARPEDYQFDWRYAAATDDPAVYEYVPQTFIGDSGNLATTRWQQKRNPDTDLPEDFSVGSVALPELVTINDSSHDLAGGFPGLVLKARDDLDFTSGIPASMVFSAELDPLDGFVLYVNGAEAVAFNAPERFTSLPAASNLSASGLSKQFALSSGFFVKGPNTVVVALFTTADPGSAHSVDFRLEGATKVDQVTLGGSPWTPLDPALSNIIATGGSPAAPLGSPILVMQDNYFTMRYRPKINTGNILAPGADQNAVPWSDWADRSLVEGWIKRVLARINPFNQRMTDLQNNTVNTDVSLLTQAGTKWEGDVALTMDALNDYGLIEIYETLLNRGKEISIDSGYDKPGVNDALLLAAGYLHDLYTILGNEAFADAANPTISIDDQTTVTEVNTSRFSFESQVASVLDEELALLRGRDDFLDPKVTIPPFYNRLFWNYTRGIDAGEVLYAVNYNIKEKAGSSTADGVIDAADAQRMFPQAHGDAYGHYLTALKGYYRLLTHPSFTWVPRSEVLSILGQTVAVDYQDERKFAEAAANVARTAQQIVALTHRQQYHDEPADGWAHFRDGDGTGKFNNQTNNTRRWGLDDWISRAGQGSYFHWVVGNAMLPDVDTLHDEGSIQKIDRTEDSVPHLALLTTAAESFQTTLDNANAHLNPLGLSPGAIAFDISPSELKAGNSHYEQIYGRALAAVLNAKGAFDQAAKMTRLLRNHENQIDDFNTAIEDEERAFKYKMIDIYGTPYPGDKGPGKTFAQDYDGPDDQNYFVVDRPSGLVDTSQPLVITSRKRVNIQNFVGFDLTALTSSLPKQFVNHTFRIQPDQLVQFADQWAPGVNMGSRSVTGRVQQALSNTQLAYIAVQAGHARLMDTYENFDRRTKLLLEVIKHNADTVKKTEDSRDLQHKYTLGAAAADIASQGLAATSELLKTTGVDLAEYLPTSVGVSTDATSGLRGTIKTTNSALGHGFKVLSIAAKVAGKTLESLKAKEIANLAQDLREIGVTREHEQLAYEYEAQYREMLHQFYEIGELALQLQKATEDVRNVLAEGDRLQLERKIQRQRAATVVQGFRVRDLTFRTFRNEGLEQYRTLFDLASRYTYLAAKSYDYETGLLGTADGRRVISSIVAARALGDLTNGVPQSTVSTLGDAGLAGTMAQLQADFSVAEGRLGINNPDSNGTLFSLRHELFRILNDPAITSDDDLWQQTLEHYIQSNVMSDPDVAAFCRNIRKTNGSAVPGIVIPFSTTIQHEKNFFGLDYAAGDHKYTPSNFATKIYSVGMVLPGYIGMDPYAIGTPNAGSPNSTDPNALGATPYVYLIPCGNDYMYAPPLGDTGETRSWKVHDQALPLPYNLGGTSFNSTQFFNANGTLSEQPWILRKHQSFRPVNDAAFFYSLIPQEFTNSRLVGRSVWNGQWKIVIPAYSLLNDEQDGLNRFVRSVRDIQLFLRTYSHSGN
ncbi:MAG TPA: hypothetical protein DDZ88_11175 [Verrucomicrobiales bacterium]|nr:hypothetical protein [Verrucomicrobiales bacterium]